MTNAQNTTNEQSTAQRMAELVFKRLYGVRNATSTVKSAWDQAVDNKTQ